MFKPTDHTFVVCAYGESPYLEACVQSLLNQTMRTNVVVSTSTPNSYISEIAGRYGLNLFINDGVPSISHDWNCALGHCSTPLVTIAHQDDVYLPEYAANVLGALSEEEHPLICFTDYGELRGERIADDSKLLNVKRMMLTPLKACKARTSRFIRRRILSFGSAICCPSVTYCLPNLPTPTFLGDMKCDLDWEAWERFSKLEGSFVYVPKILMRHRIHEGSETTALIEDDTRGREDLEMLKRFWPSSIARAINRFYARSQDSNAG